MNQTRPSRGSKTSFDREAPGQPFREFVLKLAGRCNIACTYCYMYEMADQSWRRRPPMMSDEVLEATCARIAEHVKAHGLRRIEVVFHGGEPMLAGTERIARAARRIRRSAVGAEVDLAMQTNGTLLTEEALRVLRDHSIRVAVSLDGDQVSHDRRRLRRNGKGSFAIVTRGLRLLASAKHRELFAGLLCTIDLRSDPIAGYEGLLEWSPPTVDFLLPHGNWDAPPPGLRPGSGSAPYAQWLIPVFDRWYQAPRQETSVRLFRELIHGILGGRSTTEQIGLSPVAHIVVDTDGSLEQVDSLRSAYDGAAATGLNVHDNSFDEAARHPDIVARQLGISGLGEECRRCSVVQVCGGGNYVHRYSAGRGFANPSVFCLDLQLLIHHVNQRVLGDLRRLRELK